jgi:hypothetical protein
MIKIIELSRLFNVFKTSFKLRIILDLNFVGPLSFSLEIFLIKNCYNMSIVQKLHMIIN